MSLQELPSAIRYPDGDDSCRKCGRASCAGCNGTRPMAPLRVYIAGPMSGMPDYNFPAFADAADDWRHEGHDVVTPPEITGRYWREVFNVEYTTRPPTALSGATPVTCDLFSRDLVSVCRCEAIALLPGWQKSRGAKMAIAVASALGKRFYDAMTMEEIKVAVSLSVAQVEDSR